MKVQVLMSSYNGQEYIEQQINSILSQKDIEITVFIRDDGSKDNTPVIIQRMCDEDSRVHCILEENIGVKRSFLKLVQLADPSADYYAFSDQDDIWLEDKIYTAVTALNKENNNIPLIYGSSVSLYSNNKIVGSQFVCPELRLGNFLVKNYYPGCTMVFNQKLKKLMDSVDYSQLNSFPLHDHWMNLVCTACGGKIIMDQVPHILYRQHDNNVIGDRTIIQKIRGNGLLTHSDNTRWKICQELHSYYGEMEDDNSKKIIKTVLDYKKNIKTRMKLAFHKEIKPISAVEKISIFFIVLLGKY